MKLFAVLLFFVCTAFSQDISDIEDNSFFVEEAYNQEPHVVQHTGALQYSRFSNGGFRTSSTVLTLSQEWPLLGQAVQFSYSIVPLNYETIEYATPDMNPPDSYELVAFEEGEINFRYQLTMDEGNKPVIAPEISILFRNDDGRKDHGYEFAVPVSLRLSERTAVHGNVDVGFFPHHDEPQTEIGLGVMVAYAAHRKFHLLLEAVTESERTELEGGSVNEDSQILSPGIRYLANMPEDIDLVWGGAIPFVWEEENMSAGFLLYLSLEHNF